MITFDHNHPFARALQFTRPSCKTQTKRLCEIVVNAPTLQRVRLTHTRARAAANETLSWQNGMAPDLTRWSSHVDAATSDANQPSGVKVDVGDK